MKEVLLPRFYNPRLFNFFMLNSVDTKILAAHKTEIAKVDRNFRFGFIVKPVILTG